MTFYCSNCWKEIDEQIIICPNCGADQEKLDKESYVEKLIRSLNHPEPSTPVRVAGILAQLKAKDAVPPMLEKLKTEKDPFIIFAIVDALLKIDMNLTQEIQKILGSNPPSIIKNLKGFSE